MILPMSMPMIQEMFPAVNQIKQPSSKKPSYLEGIINIITYPYINITSL